jgi:hypothetical protein
MRVMSQRNGSQKFVTFEDLERAPHVEPEAVDELLAAVKRRKAAEKAKPKRKTRPKA